MSRELLNQLREARVRASFGPLRSIRDGNQYLDVTSTTDHKETRGKLVGASVVEGLPRAWNPFYVRGFVNYGNVSRFRDEDADFIALAANSILPLALYVEGLEKRVSELETILTRIQNSVAIASWNTNPEYKEWSAKVWQMIKEIRLTTENAKGR